MKYRGVVYDVGLNFNGTGLSVEPFSPPQAEYDMRVIATELHANAVRIEGEEIGRLVTATRAAHSAGLTVFFNPWKMNDDVTGTRVYLEEAAKEAEKLRNEGVGIIFVAGCEYSIFSKGVFPGESFNERVMWMASHFPQGQMPEGGNMPPAFREKAGALNEALRSFVATARSHYHGPLTYSAGTWEAEFIDWGMFDMVGLDYYRRGESEEQYVSGLQLYKRFEKPLVVMEVGCCAYEGAAERGDGGFALLKGTNPDGSGIFEGGVVPTRSEAEQAGYIGTQLGLLDSAEAGVDGVFVFVFAFPCMRAGEGAKDLDMMTFSLVKYFPEEDSRNSVTPPWERKESFHRVADVFGQME
ncbi:uncharacterized protein DSM5745_00243 [Aspergillus mulundensis]|uniref:Abortive infection protein n=1 Tax=Aspergillus mulundensis TaxID=1810919 RepID=A0A3D8T392_9EURO|nr:hypothetical protein DSM5745_00243 [Aspergillus mulundensis]RDW92921.1 hypothetical protein DSM5745_00243 [Aspergillus mulundensis]